MYTQKNINIDYLKEFLLVINIMSFFVNVKHFEI
jgi:hypothetical protein